MNEQYCIQTRESKHYKMTIKLCSMVDSCDCGNIDCCPEKEQEMDDG